MSAVRNLVRMYEDDDTSAAAVERQREALEEIHQSLVALDHECYDTHARPHVFIVMGASVSTFMVIPSS